MQTPPTHPLMHTQCTRAHTRRRRQMWTCTHRHTHAHTHAHMHTAMHTRAHTHTCAHIRTHMHTGTRTHTGAHACTRAHEGGTHTHTQSCLHSAHDAHTRCTRHVHTCTQGHTHMHIHMQAHTHAHTNAHTRSRPSSTLSPVSLLNLPPQAHLLLTQRSTRAPSPKLSWSPAPQGSPAERVLPGGAAAPLAPLWVLLCFDFSLLSFSPSSPSPHFPSSP